MFGKKCYNKNMEMQTNRTSPSEKGKEEKQMNKKEKIIAFFENNYAMFFAPMIVLFFYFLQLYLNDVYPFSDKYTVASYDLSAQICPFIEHLFDVMDGKSTLSYSYAIAGGADVTGTFLYFFISPFSFLFLIFGDGMVARAAGIVMAFKLATTSVAGTWFAKKMFKGIPDYVCIAVGIAYAFCGYMFVANTYINWVDFLIYLPFTAAAFKHFVKTNRFLPFSILVACCIYTCFSIACFSMFTVFPVLVGYALLCIEKERRNKFIAYLAVSFAVAILLALPVLFPALMAYTRGARSGNTGLLYDFWKGYKDKTSDNPVNFDSSWYIDNYTTSLYAKISYILSDSVFVVLTLVWFYRRGLKDNFSRFMLLAGAMTLLPVLVDEAMLLMNMGSYMSYALRFGFLNALYFLGGTCLCLEGLCYQPNRAYDGSLLYQPLVAPLVSEQNNPSDIAETTDAEEVENPQNEGGMSASNEIRGAKRLRKNLSAKTFWTALVAGVCGLATLALVFFTTGDRYKNIWGYFLDDSDTLSAIRSFSSKYAHSLGGLEVILVLFFIVAIATLVCCIAVGKKKISAQFVSVFLCVIVGVQVLFYNNQMVVGNIDQSGSTTQHAVMDAYTELNAVLNSEDDSYFRVKDYKDKLTACAPFTGNANSFSVFSSVIDKDNFATYHLFAYKGNGKNSYKSSHNTDKSNRSDEFGDAFMGYKYFFVPKSAVGDFAEGKDKAKYVKPYMVAGNDGTQQQLVSSDGAFYVFENEIVFPSAYVLPSGEYRFVKPNEGNSGYRRENQSALYEFLRGKTLAEMKEATGSNSAKYVTPETARELSEYLWEQASGVTLDVGAGKITATVKGATAGECLFLNFVASQGYEVTVNGKKATLIDNDLKFLSVALDGGDNVVEFVYKTPYTKYAVLGVLVAVIGLCAVAFVLKKTRLVDWAAPVIGWAGIALATGLVAFFMVYPTAAWLVKVLMLIL